MAEDIEKVVEKRVGLHFDQFDDEMRDILSKQIRLHEQGKAFLTNEQWKQQLSSIRHMRVLKMPKILQSLMYLLGFTRESICEPRTNKLFWKKANHFLTHDVPVRMEKFVIIGQKKGDFKSYKTLNFCERVVSSYQEEDVMNYHPGFFKLFKWLKLAIEVRKQYIVRTKAKAKRDKEERVKKEEAAEERARNREQY